MPYEPLTTTGQSGEAQNGATYLFPDIAGENQAQIEDKKDSGYTELPEFTAGDHQYCCASCEYFSVDEASPTGYLCNKYKYFDRPNGCCDGWELIPELRKYKSSQQITARS